MESTINKSALTEIAEIELVYKPTFKMSSRPAIRSPEDMYQFLKSCWNLDQIQLREELKMILLNGGGQILGIVNLSSGGVLGTVVDYRLIFASALKANAVSIILAHNHPSGNLIASERDIRVTKRIKKIGDQLEIRLIDHLIISSEGYISMIEKGLI